MDHILQEFLDGMRQTGLLEYIAVFAGIASVWFSKKENILLYPIGLINTIIYIYLSMEGHLFGEASVNLYYTVMSVYGWVVWAKRDQARHPVLQIQRSTKREWSVQLFFFFAFYVFLYAALAYLKQDFAPGAIPWADALASASAYTGMWLMARKKVESWLWWILTNIISIPLYFSKGYVFTSVYYAVLLILAVLGLLEWSRKAKTTGT